MVRKKRTVKKKAASIKHRNQVKLRKENRAKFGMSTEMAESYQIVHDALILTERKEKQIYSPKELIRRFMYIHGYLVNEKDGVNNFEALSLGIAFEKPLDDLTSLLTGTKVVSKNRKEALTNAIEAVLPYYPITRRNEVKEETAKTRTTSKKKVTAKAATKKKVVVKGRTSKKKVAAKESEEVDQEPKRRGRRAAGFVVFSGAEVETNCAEEKVLSENGQDWEAFDELLKKGKVKPSNEIGYKNTEGNVFAQIINAIGENRGKAVPAKNVVQFVVDNLELSEKVARSKLYKLINTGQLDVV